VADCRQRAAAGRQVHDAQRVRVNQVGQALGGGGGGGGVTRPAAVAHRHASCHAEQVGAHELGAAHCQHVVAAVLDSRHAAVAEHEAHTVAGKVKGLCAVTVPGHLAHAAAVHVAQHQRRVRAAHYVAVLEDIYLCDVVAVRCA
jgi:hypothetical protein